MSKVEIGALGSLVFVGLTIGSSIAGIALEKLGEKIVLLVVLVLYGSALAFFGLIGSNLMLVYGARFLIGFFQVFIVVYAPVWIDSMAPNYWKTLWLTFLQLAVSIGVILGYILTAIV
jgi:MFS family permease